MKSVKVWGRLAVLLALSLMTATVTPADDTTAKKSKAGDKAAAAKAAPAKPAAKTAAPKASPKPQGSKGAGATGTSSEPEWAPVPATTGGLGLFTLETGQVLPKKGFSATVFGNKYERAPGTLSIVNVGFSVSAGLTDRITALFQFEPYRHMHVSRPNQLSLLSPAGNPQFGTTIYRSLLPVVGSAPGYAEDYPFANRNGSGVGEIVGGVRFGLLQERLGHPVNLSFGTDFIFPTRLGLSDLLDNQVQMGNFNWAFGGAVSKTWGSLVVTTFQGNYRWVRDNEFGGVKAYQAANQFRVGGGLLFFPTSRWQLMNEYNALIFNGDFTPTTTFGARDPIDGIWGFRWYVSPWKSVALDVGYRYMLNLKAAGDRNGFVVKLGTTHWGTKPAPPAVNRSPVAACSAEKSAVYVGTGESVGVSVRASDPDGDTLSYNWSATGGRVEGSGAQVRWNSAGLAQGQYTITSRVEDGHGGTASCSVDVRVEPKPNRAPSLTCSADRTTVLTGERVRITGSGSDPDGDTLAYSWRTNGGQIVGSGSTVQLDTSSLVPGRYTVTGRVEDGRGAAADCSVAVGVQTPPPPPEASKLNECFFRNGSARVDNVCKRILDDVALRLQSDPKARVVIVGYSDPAEPKTVGQKRASETKKYLAGKGIAESRVDARAAGGQKGAGKQNRRIDVVWLPEGATY